MQRLRYFLAGLCLLLFAGALDARAQVKQTVPVGVSAYSVDALGDLDSDGNPDLLIGSGSGSAAVVFLKADGTVRAQQQITSRPLSNSLPFGGNFGQAGPPAPSHPDTGMDGAPPGK